MMELADMAGSKPAAPKERGGSNPPSPTDIAWAAGLFEGEGSVYPTTIKRKDKDYYYIRINVTSTDKDVLLKFQKIFGVGKIFIKRNKPNPKWKKCYYWQLQNDPNVEWILSLLWPYLGERRRKRILELNILTQNPLGVIP